MATRASHPAAPPSVSVNTVSNDAETLLGHINVSIEPLATAVGFLVTEDQARAVALSQFAGATVCAAFPAMYTDPGNPRIAQQLAAWVFSLQPSQQIKSHGPAGSTPKVATFLYVIVDGHDGRIVASWAGAPAR